LHAAQAQTRITIDALPLVLMIDLKRWAYDVPGGKARKISDHVDLEQRLNLSPFLGSALESADYTLCAVISHSSSDVEAGHYYAQVKAANGCWYIMDDEWVSKCGESPRDGHEAYILLYVRQPLAVDAPGLQVVSSSHSLCVRGTHARAQEKSDLSADGRLASSSSLEWSTSDETSARTPSSWSPTPPPEISEPCRAEPVLVLPESEALSESDTLSESDDESDVGGHGGEHESEEFKERLAHLGEEESAELGDQQYFPDIIKRELELPYMPKAAPDWNDDAVLVHLGRLRAASASVAHRRRFDSFLNALQTVRQVANRENLLWNVVCDLVVVNYVFRAAPSTPSYSVLPLPQDLKDGTWTNALDRAFGERYPELETVRLLGQSGRSIHQPGHVYGRMLRLLVDESASFMAHLRKLIKDRPPHQSRRADDIERDLAVAKRDGKRELWVTYVGITVLSIPARDKADNSGHDNFWSCLCSAARLTRGNQSRELISLVGLPLVMDHRYFIESTLEFFFTAPRHHMKLANTLLGGRNFHYAVHPILISAFKRLAERHASTMQCAWSQCELFDVKCWVLHSPFTRS
jgi:hypothetical protein